jgi:hypothetical protein
MKCVLVPFIVFLNLLFAFPQAHAQQYYTPNYLFTIRDGLAQQQVSCFFEDSRGYIWMGSQNGLTRFDGCNLQPYVQQQGVGASIVNTIMEGPDGSIWYSTADTVYSFDGRTEVALPMTPAFWASQSPRYWPLIRSQLRRLLAGNFLEISTLSDQYAIFSDAEGAAIVIDWQKRLCHRFLRNCTTTVLPRELSGSSLPDNTGHFLVHRRAYYTWTEAGLQCVARYLPWADSIALLHPLAPAVFEHSGFNQNRYWYRDGNYYRSIDTRHFNSVDHVFLDQQRRIHIATDEGYAVMYPYGPERVELFEARHPWSVLVDGEGVIWVSSYYDGIISFVPGESNPVHHALPPHEEGQKLFSGKLQGPEGSLLFGGYQGFYHVKNGKPELFRLGEPIEAFAWDPFQQCYWVAGTKLYGINKTLLGQPRVVALPQAITLGEGVSDVEVAADGSIWVAGRGGIARISSEVQGQKIFTSVGRISTLLFDSSGVLLAGGSHGLYYLHNLINQLVPVAADLITSSVTNIVLLPNHRLAVVTEMAIVLLNVTAIQNPKMEGYWSEKNGFQLLESTKNGASYDGTYLWVAAGNGIQRLKIEHQPTSLSRPVLRLDQINGERMTFQQTAAAQIVYGNTVVVDLSLINQNADNIAVEYSVNGGEWQWTHQLTDMHLVGLEHGTNSLRFRVKIPGREAATWLYTQGSLRVVLPLMQRGFIQWLFYVGSLVSVALAILWWKKEKKGRILLEQLHQTQLNTVQAQLNPHVFFNLLSSLQNSIVNRGKADAAGHLLRIARLIREILELSMPPDKSGPYKFPTITLDKEIRFLDNYLKLESMQHSPPFEYEIINQVATHPEKISIPPLLVQPLAENAVIHGIQSQAGKAGFIQIIFWEEGGSLVITVKDDGLSKSKQSVNQEKLFRYRSRGGELLQKRLLLMGNLGYPATYSLKPGLEGGTVAEIRIKKMLCASS